MNAKELVSAALRGVPVPRVPAGPLAVHFCARIGGYNLETYSTSAEALADSVCRYYERFKPDAVWISADTWVSAQAMGAKVGAPEPGQPLGGIGGPAIRTADDIDLLPKPDVAHQGRYAMMLDALRRVVKAIGDRVYVVACFDQYPFSLAAALMGLDEIMMRALDDPPFVQALMDRCEEYAVAYARELGAAGADLLSGGDSPAGLLGPDLYHELALPHEQRVIRQIKEATHKPVSLHICGKAQPLLPLMQQSGADVIEVDQGVDIVEACRLVGPGIALWGNLDPVRLLAQGTPEDVKRAAADVLGAVRRSGHRRFVLSSGCALAVETPDANLEALFSVGRA